MTGCSEAAHAAGLIGGGSETAHAAGLMTGSTATLPRSAR